MATVYLLRARLLPDATIPLLPHSPTPSLQSLRDKRCRLERHPNHLLKPQPFPIGGNHPFPASCF
jgi:hypothetical protein